MNEYAQCRLWSPLESCSASTRLENHRQSTRRVLSLLVVSAHVRALFPASSISVCLAQSKHFLHNFSFFSDNFFELSENGSENTLKSQRLVRGGAGGKVMRENEPVLLVLSICDGEIILEKGEILSEKRQDCVRVSAPFRPRSAHHSLAEQAQTTT